MNIVTNAVIEATIHRAFSLHSAMLNDADPKAPTKYPSASIDAARMM